MVLERHWYWLLAVGLVLSLVACIKSPPVQRLSNPAAIAVAFVNDQGSALAGVPEDFAAGVEKSLTERNLIMTRLDLTQFQEEFGRKRDSRDRLATVSALVGDAPLLLLVETRAEYYSQLNGRYRWTVYVKFTMAKKGEMDRASVASFDLPVMLSFDHQREQDALAYAAGPIARKLGQELDDFLAGLDLATVAVSADAPQAQLKIRKLAPIYFVMLDRFRNGDTSNDDAVDVNDAQAFHGGDIAGLIEKLDYIRDMGFGTVWLSPIFSMRTDKIDKFGAFHGYWTEDLRTLERRFGSEEDLLRLRKELEKRDMQLVMDIVLNHVGYETKLVKDKPEWFHNKGNITDWEDPIQVTTHDVHGLPDLAQEKAEVYDYLLSASAHWVETLRPAGFRLDAVKHVSSSFWRRYTRDLRERSPQSFATIGELYDGDPMAIAAGFSEGGFSHLFDFPLYFAMNEVFCGGQSAGRLASILSLDRLYADPRRLITFADNHDLPRVWSACGQDQQRVEALLTFMLTARGIPCLNYGTEVALPGADEPANRADMIFSSAGPLRTLISDLLKLRDEHPVFQEGVDLPLRVADKQYAYLRVLDNEVAVVAVNLTSQSWILDASTLGSESGFDALTGESVSSASIGVAPGVRVVLFKGGDYRHLVERVQKSGMKTVVIVAESAGDNLRLVGGGPELGSWNPEKAPVGKSVGGSSFRFEIELPSHATAAFKLARMVAGEAVWEQRVNRFVVVDDQSEPMQITWREGK